MHTKYTQTWAHSNPCGEYKIFKELTYESTYFAADGETAMRTFESVCEISSVSKFPNCAERNIEQQ